MHGLTLQITTQLFGLGSPRQTAPVLIALTETSLLPREIVAAHVQAEVERTERQHETSLAWHYLLATDVRQQPSNMPLQLDEEIQRAWQGLTERRYLLVVDGAAIHDLDMPLTLTARSQVAFVRLLPLIGGVIMISNATIQQLQALLGVEATDDTIWQDLLRFRAVVQPIVEELWPIDITQPHHQIWHVLRPSTEAEQTHFRETCQQAVQQITERLGSVTSTCAAAFLLHPQLWRIDHSSNHRHLAYPLDNITVQLMRQLAEMLIKQSPPPDWRMRLCRRIWTCCLASSPGQTPNVMACIEFLLDDEDVSITPLIDELSTGAWDQAAQILTRLSGYIPTPQIANALRREWAHCGSLTERLVWRLAQQQRLTIECVRQLLSTLPHSFQMLQRTLSNRSHHTVTLSPTQQAWHDQLYRLMDVLSWELVSDLRPETWEVLHQITFLSGGRYLLRVAEEVDRLQLTKLPRFTHDHNRIDTTLVRLLSLLQRHADDQSTVLIGLLEQINHSALLLVLPHAPAYEAEMCAALGWPAAFPLVQYLRRIEAQQAAQSADPQAGVVVRSELLQLTAPLEEGQLRQLLDACAVCLPEAVFFVRAALGWNSTELKRMVGRKNRMALRALPLLPITKPDEALQRYLTLTRYQRETQSSSAGRKPYERAAASAALTNLAYATGYSDAVRMEWAMQAQLGSERTTIGRTWEIAGYTITLTLGDRGPLLAIQNNKRTLKRFPALVRREYAYREVQATLEQAQDQDRRIRQALLDAMRSEQPLQPDELAILRANPIAGRQLERLILIDTAGAHGLFCSDDGTLEGTHGERIPIHGAVIVAHPFALATQGVLSDWQTEIVRRQIVQPFKQVFRELYLLTPAEIAAQTTSNRLAGRRLRSRQAWAVLANMGWLIDGDAVQKPFYQFGVTAELTLEPDHSDDQETVQIGTIRFWRLGERRWNSISLPLTEIPPIMFSEVVRDIDLVTSIAHQSVEGGTSREVIQRRGDLVRATIQALGLRQVHVEEPSVFVTGQRTNYRIQLATGAVYFGSGQYLCIVPASARQKPIYLPFAEGGDPVTSEIISKVLLLAHDYTIRDETILAQIIPQPQAA